MQIGLPNVNPTHIQQLESSHENDQSGNDNPNQTRKVISISNETLNSNIQRKLKCLNTNAQSLQYKLNELKNIIDDYDVQIAAVTETWGKP